jgi:hypothetical protein
VSNYELKAILGYDELVNNESHYDDLNERDETALKIFMSRKNEIERR